MDDSRKDIATKKKLENFLQELHLFGTLRGFKHFSCQLRGREELIISVNNALQGNSLPNTASLLTSTSRNSVDPSQSGRVSKSNVASAGTGTASSISPSDQELTSDANVTVFLIAGYARYSSPYVWLRSGHGQVQHTSNADRNNPLSLKSTTRWKDGDVQVTDIIAELVKLYTYPAPQNPFEINQDYFQSLPQPERMLCSAAIVTGLQKILIHTPDSKSYMGKVFEDLQHVAKLHFACLREMTTAANIPILRENFHQRQHPTQPKLQQYYQPQEEPRRNSGTLQGRYPNVSTSVGTAQHQPSLTVQPSNPVNASNIIYGQGACGVFPGGFNRMPAPSMF